jgi:hypothetical protein
MRSDGCAVHPQRAGEDVQVAAGLGTGEQVRHLLTRRPTSTL